MTIKPISLTVNLLLATLATTVHAEPADSWSAAATPPPALFGRSSAAPAAPVAAPVPTTPLVLAPPPAPVAVSAVARPTPSAPRPVQAVARPAAAPQALHSSYSYVNTPAKANAASGASNAPTILADKTPVPQVTQQDLDERLWLAALAGNLPVVMDMVDQGANPRVATRHGETTIHAAAARGHGQIVEYLSKRGVNIHARTSNGWTALHHAVRFGHANVVSFLVKSGANPRLPTNDAGQKTPLDIAMDRNDLRMARLLGY